MPCKPNDVAKGYTVRVYAFLTQNVNAKFPI